MVGYQLALPTTFGPLLYRHRKTFPKLNIRGYSGEYQFKRIPSLTRVDTGMYRCIYVCMYVCMNVWDVSMYPAIYTHMA